MVSGPYDLVTLGRANMDLFSQNVGVPFEDITGFDAMVGGSPANIAIGVSRLGLRAVMLTAVGTDRVGDFVLRYLRDEKVEMMYAPRVSGKLTSLALLGVQPPSHFPLSFYREDPADIYLDPSTVEDFPFSEVAAVQISGNALSRGPCASAARRAAEIAVVERRDVYLDLDLRPTDWDAPEAYGLAMRELMASTTVVIGTEEEFYAALMDEPGRVMDGSRVSGNEHLALDQAIEAILSIGPKTAVVKRGSRGATLIQPDAHIDVPGFTIEPVNTVGAGDAFAAGLIRSLLLGWNWERATRFANACGALMATRHGCSVALPTTHEVESFIEEHV